MDKTAQITRAATVLQVNRRTMRPMIDFFVEHLGFTIGTQAGAGPYFVTLDRANQTVMLDCMFDPLNLRRVNGWAIYFWVDDVEAIEAELKERHTALKGPIVEKEYGCLEVVAIAPDGREIVFGELLNR